MFTSLHYPSPVIPILSPTYLANNRLKIPKNSNLTYLFLTFTLKRLALTTTYTYTHVGVYLKYVKMFSDTLSS